MLHKHRAVLPLLAFALYMAPSSLALAAAANNWTVTTILGITVSGGNTPVANVINTFLNILYSVAGGSALVVILWGAYRYMSAAGDPKVVQEARETIKSAIYGLVLVLLAFLLAQIIGGDSLTGITV